MDLQRSSIHSSSSKTGKNFVPVSSLNNTVFGYTEALDMFSISKINSPSKEKPSKYKGVYKCGKKWKAQVQVAGVQHYLGVFEKEEEAAEAYDQFIDRNHRDSEDNDKREDDLASPTVAHFPSGTNNERDTDYNIPDPTLVKLHAKNEQFSTLPWVLSSEGKRGNIPFADSNFISISSNIPVSLKDFRYIPSISSQESIKESELLEIAKIFGSEQSSLIARDPRTTSTSRNSISEDFDAIDYRTTKLQNASTPFVSIETNQHMPTYQERVDQENFYSSLYSTCGNISPEDFERAWLHRALVGRCLVLSSKIYQEQYDTYAKLINQNPQIHPHRQQQEVSDSIPEPKRRSSRKRKKNNSTHAFRNTILGDRKLKEAWSGESTSQHDPNFNYDFQACHLYVDQCLQQLLDSTT